MSGDAVAGSRARRCSLSLAATLSVSTARAQPSALVGDWFLTLDERRAVHTGTLDDRIERRRARGVRRRRTGHVQARRRHGRDRVRHARRRRPAAPLRAQRPRRWRRARRRVDPAARRAAGHVARRAARRAAARAAAARRFHRRLVAHVVGPGARDARLHAGRASARRRVPLPRRSVAALRVAGPRAHLRLAVSARDRAERHAGDDPLRELPRGSAHLPRRPRLSRDAAASRDGLLARPLGRLDARRRDEDAHAGLRRSRRPAALGELARRRAHVAER